MKSQTVLNYPNRKLQKAALPVKYFGTKELDALIDSMVATMRLYRGIGLAATQIGLNMQLAVIETKDGPLVMANPRLEKISTSTEDDEEGCLSLPMIYGVVPRAKSLVLHACDQNGTPYTLSAKGLLARVIQHEYDHLRGKLYIDRCIRLTAGSDKAASLGIVVSGP